MDSRAMTIVLLLWFLSIATFAICNGNVGVPCKASERQALLMFKNDLEDHSNRFSSWSGEGDCCTWTGVVCDNLTAHVQELHLAGNWPRNDGYLGGTVNPSLLNLTHLSYLDLSGNDFQGIQIPSFLGSLKRLRYLNLSYAGFEGIIPRQLGNISSLHYLDLGENFGLMVENLHWLSTLSLLKHLDMTGVDLSKASRWLQVTNTLPSLAELHMSDCGLDHIPSGIANMTSLKVLDLSSNIFNSTLPTWLYNTLPSLVELHMSDCRLHHIPSGIANMTSLKVLDLSSNFFNSTLPTWLYNTLPSLAELHMSDCGLYHIPSGIANMTSLKVLDLSSNIFNSTLPTGLYRLSHLESLILSGSDLHGEISSSIGNLTALVNLQLDYNQLEGIIPNSLENVCKLTYLDLSGNMLRGNVSEIFESLSRCNSSQIDYLLLSENNLSGHLPDHLGSLTSLSLLDLSSNSISGPIPVSLGNLSRLEVFIVYNNSLKGVVSEAHFTNLSRLDIFVANDNSLILKTSPDWHPPFQVSSLMLGSWHLEPSELPNWLQTQANLFALNMSNTGISGTIPTWFWNFSSAGFGGVDLSYNQLYGEVPNIVAPYSAQINLGSNQFNGLLPLFSSPVSLIDLSNSSFSGTLFHFLCDKSHGPKQLQILLLHNNLLTGEIPNCFLNLPNLELVNLESNSLTGNLPSSIGYLNFLQSLHLRNNHLSGELPVSLANCESLFLLDLAKNKFVGRIPIGFGKNLSNLGVLSLRSNKLHGETPSELCNLKHLRILDLADNNLSGGIPSCFYNFTPMLNFSSSEYPISFQASQVYLSDIQFEHSFSSLSQIGYIENVVLVRKAREDVYNKLLRWVTSLDLSNNNISGEIPEELTRLICLQSLNLSQNHLTGQIPSKIGDMRRLESLDLSMNNLSGEIPPTMSSLSYLSYLNLSNNSLVGEIPKGTQLQSFTPFSYFGNKLCGPPLEVNCSNGSMPTVGDEKHDEGHFLEDGWFYLSLGLGFACGFWCVLGSLLLNMPWSNAFSQFLNNIVNKLMQ